MNGEVTLHLCLDRCVKMNRHLSGAGRRLIMISTYFFKNFLISTASIAALALSLLCSNAHEAYADDSELSLEFLRAKLEEMKANNYSNNMLDASNELREKIEKPGAANLVKAKIQSNIYAAPDFNKYINGCDKANFSEVEYDRKKYHGHRDFRLYLIDFEAGNIGKIMFARDYMRDSDWTEFGSLKAFQAAKPSGRFSYDGVSLISSKHCVASFAGVSGAHQPGFLGVDSDITSVFEVEKNFYLIDYYTVNKTYSGVASKFPTETIEAYRLTWQGFPAWPDAVQIFLEASYSK